MTERDIFLAVLDLPDPAARTSYLDAACGGDAARRARVHALLQAHESAGSFLAEPAVAAPDPGRYATRTFAAGADGNAARATGEQHGADDEDLAFLTPSKRPDSLGRIGHYEVLEVLGRGGFGIVFRAFDDVLQRVVAVKVLAPAMAATSPARKRFLREARSSAQVRHENVVQVHAVEEQPLPYLVMEFIPGETLQQRLDRNGPLDVPEVLRVGRQVAEGLAAAHAQGLIHRDIKPANVLIEGGPPHRVKLTDFGLARAADDASISQSGIVAGTPMYMAPEQARGETLDHRADLFSLGSVLYAMLTGHPPFRASGTLAVLKRVCEDDPRPIREVIPEVPTWLCRVVERLHAKDPIGRFQTAGEVADLLADAEGQWAAYGAVMDYSRVPGGGPAKTSVHRRHRIVGACLAGAEMVLLIVVGILVDRSGWSPTMVLVYGFGLFLGLAVGLVGLSVILRGSEPPNRIRRMTHAAVVCAVIAAGFVVPLVGNYLLPSGHVKPESPFVNESPLVVPWGEVIDPLGDCRVNDENGLLTITVPGTRSHNLNPSPGFNLNAPRVLRDVEGDFEARVTVLPYRRPRSSVTTSPSQPYVGAGLVVWQDESHFLRLFRSWMPTSDTYVHPEWYGGTAAATQVTANVPDRPTHLRVRRTGQRLDLAASLDGRTWTEVTSANDLRLPARVRVGVAAVNSTDEELSVRFEGLSVEPIAMGTPPAAAKSDDDAIQGTWTGVAADNQGLPIPEMVWKAVNPTVTFAGDKVTWKVNPTPEAKDLFGGLLAKFSLDGIFHLDPTKSPKAIDLTVLGPNAKTPLGRPAPRALLGIYRLEGDSLELCIAVDPEHAEDRPAKFESVPGKFISHIKLRRQPPKGGAADPAIIQALRDLVAAKGRAQEITRTRFEVGQVSGLEDAVARIDLLEARVRLAEAEGDRGTVVPLLQDLVARREDERGLIAALVAVGRSPPDDLDRADARLAEAKTRLAQARSAAKPLGGPPPMP